MDLVLVPGFVSNIEGYWQVPNIPQILERLGSFARVVIFDKRGTGLSDPVSEVPTLDQRMDDMRAVMEAAGIERATLYGISEGGPASILFAATFPDRVTSLVLYGSSPRFGASVDFPWGMTEAEAERSLAEIEEDWGGGAMMDLFFPTGDGDPQARELWGRFLRAGASPAMGARVVRSML